MVRRALNYGQAAVIFKVVELMNNLQNIFNYSMKIRKM